ncbi:bacterio-opsin activator domain-containing protein [Halolamina salifodinae]|uniref:AraC-like DNA-binding protein n=1 Tax=Halolamina salifodinae TaxID=1202767 RepID=A0A8T4GZF3_9EURY|nr:bacterio-opsin activator domain-containing protein [Halolamina salifodinae]MBP1987682.1 AraC-like DNA-binding protein [Halolamina salifodinae]
MSLDREAYQRVRRAARTHREELVVRLCGEAGLRPAEQARVRPGDLFEHHSGHLLAVFDTGRAGENSPEPARETALPAEVARDLRQYAASNGLGDDEPLFSVSARRLSMLLGEVVDRTAGVDASATDLRRQFAARLLDDGVPPETVVELGGWERLDSLAPLLADPERDDLIAAVSGAGGADSEPQGGVTAGLTTALLDATADLADTLGDADRQEAVATTACERLAGVDGVRFAWAAERVGDTVTLQAVAGAAERTVRRQLDNHREAVEAAVGEGETRTVEGANGTMTLAPIGAGDAAGLLALGTALPDDTAADAVAAVAGQVGHALTAVERKRLLLADAVVELDFRCPASASVVADLSAALDCRVELSGVVPVDDGSLLYYLDVEGSGAEAVVTRADAADGVDDARVLAEYGDGATVEVVVTDTPAIALLDAGGRIHSLVATDGTATLTGELAGDADVRAAVGAVTEIHPAVDLLAKRRTDHPAETATGFRERLSGRLSDRQATVLRAAYRAGYFEWPRDSTAEELADSVGVSSPTLHNHLRKAEGKLLTAFFEQLPSREADR